MKRLSFVIAFLAAFLLASGAIQAPKRIKVLRLKPIQPTPILQWIDTCSVRYDIPREVIVGIATNESSFGTSYLGKNHNNWFGIKYFKGSYYKGDFYTSSKGNDWRKYPSAYEGIEDFCQYMQYHYPKMIGKPLEQWNLYGYKSTPYLASYFVKFRNM